VLPITTASAFNVVAPVPPRATVRVPLEIEDAFNDVMFAPEKVAVVEPVPPEATGSAVARVREVRCVMASVQSVALLYTYIVLPAGTATPVWPVTFIVTVSAQPLLTI
jgi:hypothetical protein